MLAGGVDCFELECDFSSVSSRIVVSRLSDLRPGLGVRILPVWNRKLPLSDLTGLVLCSEDLSSCRTIELLPRE